MYEPEAATLIDARPPPLMPDAAAPATPAAPASGEPPPWPAPPLWPPLRAAPGISEMPTSDTATMSRNHMTSSIDAKTDLPAPAPPPPHHMATVTRDAYHQWEAQVLASFPDRVVRSTALVPSDGAPSVLRKHKWILVADSHLKDRDMMAASSCVQEGATANLPAKKSIRMWHIGNGCLDSVSYGHSDSMFKHPACDVGGLTNLPQELGTAATFVDGEEGGVDWPSPSMSAATLATMLHAWWCQLTSKKLPASLREGLTAWLDSLRNAMPDGARLRFHELQPEHRIVATASDVKASTGRYFVRIYDGSTSDNYARESDGEGLFCALADKYITPNINLQNLHIEYERYDTEHLQAEHHEIESKRRRHEIEKSSVRV
jgi:hypothetical protein